MREPETYWCESRSEFQAATARLLGLARHQIWLLDPNFDDWLIDTIATVSLISEALQRSRQAQIEQMPLTLLVNDPEWIEQNAPRLMAIRRRQSSAFETKQIPAQYQRQESVLLVDNQHAVIRPHKSSFRAKVIVGQPSEVEHRAAKLRQIRDLASHCLQATTLGL